MLPAPIRRARGVSNVAWSSEWTLGPALGRLPNRMRTEDSNYLVGVKVSENERYTLYSSLDYSPERNDEKLTFVWTVKLCASRDGQLLKGRLVSLYGRRPSVPSRRGAQAVFLGIRE